MTPRHFGGATCARAPHTPMHLARYLARPHARIAPNPQSGTFGAIWRELAQTPRRTGSNEMQARPTNRHGHTTNQAHQADRLWFSERPERSYRLRAVHECEVAQYGGSTHVLVGRLHDGGYQRAPLLLIGTPPGLTDTLERDDAVAKMLDAVLFEIYIAALGGRPFQVIKAIRAGTARAKAANSFR